MITKYIVEIKIKCIYVFDAHFNIFTNFWQVKQCWSYRIFKCEYHAVGYTRLQISYLFTTTHMRGAAKLPVMIFINENLTVFALKLRACAFRIRCCIRLAPSCKTTTGQGARKFGNLHNLINAWKHKHRSNFIWSEPFGITRNIKNISILKKTETIKSQFRSLGSVCALLWKLYNNNW